MTPSPAQSAVHHSPSSTVYRPWLHRFACLLVVATFVLVASGGNVTSRDAGLAVPDGFTVYGYFLWAFPMDQWVGNIFHEHIHRLKGSVIGLLTIGLALWLWRTDARRWMRWFGVALVMLVILQGIMGGLRVEFARWWPAGETPFRIFHGVTGQLFLCLTVVAAVALSRLWVEKDQGSRAEGQRDGARKVRVIAWGVIGVLLVQLVLGAAMRHTDSGLAIPDFPANYGGIVPPLTQAALDDAIAARPYDQFIAHFTVPQVAVHFGHRIWAIVVVAVIAWFIAALMRYNREHPSLKRPAVAMILLLLAQIALGAAVIWTGRHHDIATAHQAIGALILAIATLLALRVYLVEPAMPREDASGKRINVVNRRGLLDSRLEGAGA